MSIAGKCDLYDHVYMIGSRDTTKYMTKQEMFDVFKQRTNGTIYQSIRVPVTKFNIDLLLENNKFLKKTENNTYEYFGTEYKTLKQLNKVGVFYKREIHFDTMLDLVPYLPYIISIMTSDENGEYIEIGEHSYIDQQYLENLKYGYDSSKTWKFNMKRLQEEYIETIKNMGF